VAGSDQLEPAFLEEILRLTSIIDNLLTLAKADQGLFRAEFSEVNLKTVAEELYEDCEILASEKKIRITLEAGTPITIAPKAYANVLRAAITNTGTAIVAWSQQSIGLDVDSAMSVSAVSLDRAKSRVGNVITLDHGTRSEVARPGFELVASPTGGATLAWSQVDKRGDEISVANADNGGKFQRRHQIIRGAAELGGLAIRDALGQPQAVAAGFGPHPL